MNVQARVEKLERENRRIKRIGLSLVAIVALVVVAMGARKNYSAFDWVSAYGFTLRDEKQRDRGGMHYSPKIGPHFYLKDEDGTTKIKITLEGATRTP